MAIHFANLYQEPGETVASRNRAVPDAVDARYVKGAARCACCALAACARCEVRARTVPHSSAPTAALVPTAPCPSHCSAVMQRSATGARTAACRKIERLGSRGTAPTPRVRLRQSIPPPTPRALEPLAHRYSRLRSSQRILPSDD